MNSQQCFELIKEKAIQEFHKYIDNAGDDSLFYEDDIIDVCVYRAIKSATTAAVTAASLTVTTEPCNPRDVVHDALCSVISEELS